MREAPAESVRGTPPSGCLFERSILLPIPSCLTRDDEDDIIRAFEEALEKEAAVE